MARETIPHEAVSYDREQHAAFVCTSWCMGSGERADVLEELLASPDTRCLVAHQPDAPSRLLGWACTTIRRGRWHVVWAFTRDLFTRERAKQALAHGLTPPEPLVRRKGLMTSLLLALGIDPSQPTPCLYWSPDAAAITARGYRFLYAPKGLKEAA